MKMKINKIVLWSLVLALLFGVNMVFAKDNPEGMPFKAIWKAIANLQKQIDTIQLIPGPSGPQGEPGPQGLQGKQGPPGEPSWDEQRISTLEQRVAALEEQAPPLGTIILWDNYSPSTDETRGDWIDVSGHAQVVLNFDWQPGNLTHTCQYEYLYSNDAINTDFNSTYLYFSPPTCQGTAIIPIGAKYLKIKVWTPPSGTLNANLSLE